MRRRLAIILSLWLPCSVIACGDDDETTTPTTTATGSGGHAGQGGGAHDVDEHACEHFANGPFEAVTASASTANAPDVSAAHQAFQITLVEAGGGGSGGGGGSDSGTLGGFVSFPSADAADYVFFLDEDVPFAIEDSSGAAADLIESCDPAACSASCAAIRGRHVVEFGVGTYYLVLGPTSETQVTLVHEEVGHEH